ncbi:unnamed protein product [Urochloa humidicola]
MEPGSDGAAPKVKPTPPPPAQRSFRLKSVEPVSYCEIQPKNEKNDPEGGKSLFLEVGAKEEIYTEEHEKLLGTDRIINNEEAVCSQASAGQPCGDPAHAFCAPLQPAFFIRPHCQDLSGSFSTLRSGKFSLFYDSCLESMGAKNISRGKQKCCSFPSLSLPAATLLLLLCLFLKGSDDFSH